MTWEVPVTITEHHRVAIVTAESKSQAQQRARQSQWEHLEDAQRYTVTVVGAATRLPERPA